METTFLKQCKRIKEYISKKTCEINGQKIDSVEALFEAMGVPEHVWRVRLDKDSNIYNHPIHPDRVKWISKNLRISIEYINGETNDPQKGTIVDRVRHRDGNNADKGTEGDTFYACVNGIPVTDKHID